MTRDSILHQVRIDAAQSLSRYHESAIAIHNMWWSGVCCSTIETLNAYDLSKVYKTQNFGIQYQL